MNILNEYKKVRQIISTSPLFYVMKADEQRLVAVRNSKAPKRGILRLLIPQAQIVITESDEQRPVISVRPDPIAIFMLIVLLGGVAVEFLMDRSIYPREYPPEFVYGLAAFYFGLLIVEITNTKKQVRKLLGQ